MLLQLQDLRACAKRPSGVYSAGRPCKRRIGRIINAPIEISDSQELGSGVVNENSAAWNCGVGPEMGLTLAIVLTGNAVNPPVVLERVPVGPTKSEADGPPSWRVELINGPNGGVGVVAPGGVVIVVAYELKDGAPESVNSSEPIPEKPAESVIVNSLPEVVNIAAGLEKDWRSPGSAKVSVRPPLSMVQLPSPKTTETVSPEGQGPPSAIPANATVQVTNISRRRSMQKAPLAISSRRRYVHAEAHFHTQYFQRLSTPKIFSNWDLCPKSEEG